MLAKVTSPTQLTLPETILQEMGSPEYFTVALDAGRLILTPSKPDAGVARGYLSELGINEQDAADAIQWHRSK